MDPFFILGGGAKFDKKRFGHDIQLFEGNAKAEKQKSAKKNAAATDPNLKKQLLSEIDVFGTPQSAPVQTETTNETTEDALPEPQEPITTVKEANAFRKKHRIHTSGTDVPNPFRSFEHLSMEPYNLHPTLCKNLRECKYLTPTVIQTQSIPIMLQKRDLMSCAPTGSGKTLAYLLPILQDLAKSEKVGYRALIIAPTRELTLQIHRELTTLGAGMKLKTNLLTKATAAQKQQAPQYRQKYDILISTPLRLVHAIKEKEVDLQNVRHLVLDEADKLLALGFLEQTDEILAACSGPQVQKAMFSATFSSTVEELAKTVLKNPIRITVGARNAATDTIKQELIFTGNEAGKRVALRQLIHKGIRPPVLIFVQSIERAKELFHELVYDGLNVEVIHSERTKLQRDNIINQFRLGRIWVLIATELMARGLDFKGVNLVINYDFPQSVASYIHRIGRTGRAGRAGEAVTYYTNDDMPYLRSVVNVMKESGCEVPEWMLKLKKPNHAQRKTLRRAIERETIDTTSKYDKKKEARKKEIIEASKKRKRKAQEAAKAEQRNVAPKLSA